MTAELAILAKLEDQASRGLEALEGDIKNLDKAGGAVGKGMNKAAVAATAVAAATVAAGVAVAAFGVSSAKAFIGFQDSMNEVFTLLPDITDAAMGEMSDAVLAFGVDVGRTSDEVIPALYQSLSAGVPKDNVFEFMETAHKAALGGVTDLETAVDGITSVVNAYGSDVIDATQASDQMFTAVRLGKTTFGELSGSLSNVIPLASGMGVAFGDVTAALATMTAQGTPTAQATTQMRAVLSELGTEGTVVNGVFKDIAGEGFLEFIDGGGNVAEALQMVEEHAIATDTPIQDLFGNVRAGLGALQLTGSGMESFVSNLDAMNNSAGATEAAYERMNSGMARIFEVLGSMWESFKIKAGAALAPIVEAGAQALQDFAANTLPLVIEKIETVVGLFGDFATAVGDGESVIGALIDLVSDLALQFGASEEQIAQVKGTIEGLLEKAGELAAKFMEFATPIAEAVAGFVSLQDILIALGGIILAIVIPAVIGFLAPMLALVGIAMLVIGAIALLRNAWESDFMGIRTAVEGVIEKVQEMGGIGAVFEEIKTKILTAIQPIADILAPTFDRIKEAFAGLGESMGPVGGKLDGLKEAFGRLMTALQPIAVLIGAVLVVAFKILGEIVAQVFTRIGPIVGAVVDYITGQIDALIKIIDGLVQFVTGVFQGDWEAAWSGLEQVVEGVVDGIENALETALEIVDNVMGGIWDAISNVIEDLTGEAIPSWEEFKEAVVEAFEGAKQAVEDGIEAISNFFEDLVENVKEWGADIIENFVTALKEAPGKITETLQDWYQTFLDWVTNIDWYQVGYDVVTFILTGFDYLTEELPATVAEWATDMIKAIGDKASEWLEAGVEIIENIIEGLKDFPDKAGDEVDTWPDKIAGLIGEASELLIAVGEDIVTFLVDGVKAFSEFMSEEVATWPAAISGFILENIAAFTKIGEDIGAGIREGIKNMLAGIKQMVKDVISGAHAAGEDAAESTSPSRLFMRLGEDLMAGLALGVLNASGEVARAVTEAFVDVDTAAVAAVAETITTISEMMSGAISAMYQLSALQTQRMDTSMIAPFVEFMHALALAVAEIAVDLDGLRNQTLRMVEIITEVSGMIGVSIQAMQAIAFYDVPTDIVPKLETLISVFGDLTIAMGEIALLVGEKLFAATEAFASAIEAVAGMVGEAVKAAMILSAVDFSAIVQGWHLADQIKIFSRIVGTLMREFLFAALQLGIGLSNAVEDFAQAAEEVIGLVEDGIAAAVTLSEMDFGSIIRGMHLANQIVIFRNIIRTLMREFAEAAQLLGGELSQAVEDFAKAASEVVDLVESGIAAAKLLADTDFGEMISGMHLANQIVIFRNIIRTLMREFGEAAIGMESNEAIEDFISAAGAIVGLVGDAIEAMKAIGEMSPYVEEGAGSIDLMTIKIQKLADFVDRLVDAFEIVAVEMTTEVSTAVQEFADAADAVVGFVGDAIEAMKAIGEMSPYVEEGAGGIDLLAAKILKLSDFVDQLVDAFEIVAVEMTTEVSTAVQNFADAADAILGIIGPAIEAIEALATFEAVEGLAGKVEIFAGQLDTAITILAEKMAYLAGYLGDQVGTAQEFALAVGDIFESISKVADGLAAIAAVEMKDTTPQMEFILAQSKIMAEKLTGAETVSGTIVQAANDFATAVGEMVTAVQSALDGIAALVGSDAPGSLQGILDAMVTNMNNAAPDSGAAGKAIGDAFSNALFLVLDTIPGNVEAIVDAIIAAFRGGIGDAATAGHDIGIALKNALEAEKGPVGTAGFNLGAASGDGIISGLNSKLSGVRAAARALAAAAAAGASAELEIGSPSKVFERLGEQARLGFELPFKSPVSPMQLISGAGTAGTTFSNTREGDVNIYLSIPGGSGSGSVRREVQTAVTEAMRQSGRAAESRIRMR